jgi:hypothetical protein
VIATKATAALLATVVVVAVAAALVQAQVTEQDLAPQVAPHSE